MRSCWPAANWLGGCEVASVCIKPWAVALAREALAGSGVAVCTVVGFPHGSESTSVKAFAAREACRWGAGELDMVVNVGKVLSRDWRYVADDIRAVVEVAHEHSGLAKVIFENELLPDDALKIELCRICSDAGADFVKTSTGFGFVPRPDGGFQTIGATDADLLLMRRYSAPRVKLKASGGVRTYADALRVVGLGADRIGTSSTEAIAAGEREAGQQPKRESHGHETIGPHSY